MFNYFCILQALIKLYRVEAPQLLLRKNRGRPTQITAKKRLLAYGEIDAADHVPGADILDENVPAGTSKLHFLIITYFFSKIINLL